MPLIRNLLKPVAKSLLVPLRLTAAASDEDTAIHEKIFGSGIATLLILNEERSNIMEIVQSLKDSVLLIKGVSKTTKNEAKEQKRQLIGILLGTLSASLLENLLTDKFAVRAAQDV